MAAAESSMMAIMKIPTVMYGVREAKIIAAKPEAKSTAFRRIPFPGRATVHRRASCTSFVSPYLCRKRLAKWMAKSTASPRERVERTEMGMSRSFPTNPTTP